MGIRPGIANQMRASWLGSEEAITVKTSISIQFPWKQWQLQWKRCHPVSSNTEAVTMATTPMDSGGSLASWPLHPELPSALFRRSFSAWVSISLTPSLSAYVVQNHFFFLFPRLKSCLQLKEKKKESKHSNLLLSVLLSEQLCVRSTKQEAGLFELGVQLCHSLLSNLSMSARWAQPQCHSRNTALNFRWVSTENRAWYRPKVYAGFKTTKRCLPVVFRGRASHPRHSCIDSSCRC